MLMVDLSPHLYVLQVAATTVEHTNVETNQPSAYRVVIVDGMAVVNSVIKTDRMKTCQDLQIPFWRSSVKWLQTMMRSDWCSTGT